MFPLESFKDYIHKNSLFQDNSKILITVSGGKDSVLMAYLFKLAGYDFGIAHCNFNLRADESQRDESFVKLLAATLEVPFHVVHFDTKTYSAEQGISTQMAARDLRYAWFEEIRVLHKYDVIAVAHHQNDVIETVLLNLTRGTGIAGLHGILPKKGYVVRPLLFLSRPQIEEIIEKQHLDYVEDSSNQKDSYARNKIRLKVIPELKLINKALEQTFQHNVGRFAETEMVLQQVVAGLREEILQEKVDGIHISIEKVRNLVPQKLLLYELLQPYHFSEMIVSDVLRGLESQSGTSFYSESHRLTVDRTDLILTSAFREDRPHHIMVHPKDEIVLLGTQQILISYVQENLYGSDPNVAYVDSDLLIFPLVVRTRQEGDKFMPFGMKTLKKLSNFFIDEKVPLPKKEVVPILVNGNGELIWIAGLRQDNRYKVTATTKKVAIFELKFK